MCIVRVHRMCVKSRFSLYIAASSMLKLLVSICKYFYVFPRLIMTGTEGPNILLCGYCRVHISFDLSHFGPIEAP